MKREEAINLADLLMTHFAQETNIRSYVCERTNSLYIRINSVAIKVSVEDAKLIQKDIFGDVDYYPISSCNLDDTGEWDHGHGD